jgi:hypothetical protein
MAGRYDIDAILEQVDLRALAEEAGAVFGHDHSSVCPLHPGADNPAAFHIYQGQDGHWRWHCFTRCPEGQNGGDAIAFFMRWRNVGFKTAVRELAQRTGIGPECFDIHGQGRAGGLAPALKAAAPAIDPPGDHWQARAWAFVAYAEEQLRSPAGRPALEYLHRERGLDEDTIHLWRLGYNPRDVWQDPEAWGLTGKRIWCSRGIVVPGMRDGVIWYVKVRRPLPDDPLSQAIGAVEQLPDVKFSGPRGGRATLFGADYLTELPVLLLAEGEFDALLAWQVAHDLCDVASLGGAKHRLDAMDAAALAGAWAILVVYDVDRAGTDGNAYLRSVSERVVTVKPLAHDLTAYWRQGSNLRGWVAGLVAEQMERLLNRLDERRHQRLFVKWLEIYERALAAGAG